MPELPEVETISRELNRKIKNRRIIEVWTDWPKYFRLPASEAAFNKCIVGRKITGVRRRAKYVLVDLSGDYLLAVHQKMTGHLLVGQWAEKSKIKNPNYKIPENWENEKWIPRPFEGPLTDPMNRFIRLVFYLDNKKMLVLSDVRRFAKILCGPRAEVEKRLEGLGPEPLELNLARFRELFRNKRGRIKQVLMNPGFIAGIGNIYADEILYAAKVHPLSRVEKLDPRVLKTLYKATLSTLKRAVELKGTSVDDYRIPDGRKGQYGEVLLVYQRAGQKCPRGHVIKRIVIAGRSAHFCPAEQKLYQ